METGDESQSIPNLKEDIDSAVDVRQLYSLSLSQLRKHSDFADSYHKPSPFNIRWLHGYNPKAGVINLNDEGSTTVFYAATNCGILYNWTTNQMRILQGHRHIVMFVASDARGRWLMTADSGPENIVIIWDSTDYFPQRTLYSPHGNTKLSKVALSADAKYLLTLAYTQQNAVLHWWIWCLGQDDPHAKLEVANLPKDSVIQMDFNPCNSVQFVLMTKNDIWIGVSDKIFVMERGELKETDDYEIKIKIVERKKLIGDYGKLTCFEFIESTAQIIVGTSKGAVLVYGYSIEYQTNSNTLFKNYLNLKFVKPLRVESHKINVVKYIDNLIVTGNDNGEIHFYDDQMKLVYWVHGFRVDSVKGLSFNLSPRSHQIFDAKCGTVCPCWEKVIPDVDPNTGYISQKLLKQKLPEDTTIKGKPFVIRDFIVCTHNQGIGFVDFVTERLKTIADIKIAPALSLTVHPDKPFVCISYADGNMEMFNFVQHKLFKRLDFREAFTIVIPPDPNSLESKIQLIVPDLSATCIKFSPSGLHLACGLNNGELLFVDPTTMDLVTKIPHKDTSHAIQEITFSPDSLTLAMADVDRTLCVYKYDCREFVWIFIGKHRAHYKDISAIFFLPEKNESGDYKLLSLGADRVMVEYDIGNSKDEYLELYSLDRIDQTAVPLTGIHWPTPKNLDPEECRTDITAILVANDEHKYKVMNVATTMTLATVLGPRFEHPVCKMMHIKKMEGEEEMEYILFATKIVIGLQKLPLDGNPWRHVGLLGHPIEVIQMCFREDTGTLFTIGAKDSVMIQWAANYRSVEITTQHGGIELDPYYCLIENGRPGWLFQEIRDLFYYIQILCQGTFSPAMRRVKDYIPIDSMPDLMRALGFFPSEYEVENLLTEAKYKIYRKKPVNEMDFEEFVKLYLNHKPAFGDNLRCLRKAFQTFAVMDKNTYSIYRDDFIDTLTNYGELFTRQLAWYLLSILSGHSFEDRANMPENDFQFLPEDITLSYLVTQILGIQEMESMSELTLMESTDSQEPAIDSD